MRWCVCMACKGSGLDPAYLVISRNEIHHVITCVATVSRSGQPRDVARVGHGRRRAGSLSARWRATASGPGRA